MYDRQESINRLKDVLNMALFGMTAKEWRDSLSFRPKGEISCPESICTTFTY